MQYLPLDRPQQEASPNLQSLETENFNLKNAFEAVKSNSDGTTTYYPHFFALQQRKLLQDRYRCDQQRFWIDPSGNKWQLVPQHRLITWKLGEITQAQQEDQYLRQLHLYELCMEHGLLGCAQVRSHGWQSKVDLDYVLALEEEGFSLNTIL